MFFSILKQFFAGPLVYLWSRGLSDLGNPNCRRLTRPRLLLTQSRAKIFTIGIAPLDQET